jgi:tripartite-type tricarboxylate transporter receptor subunit TctC
MSRTAIARFAAPFVVMMAALGPALAQSYPTKPITMIIPFAPGGSTDIAGRIISEGMAAQLGQSIIVENRAGAGGAIGAKAVADAAPDGHTILTSGMNNFAFPYGLELPLQFNVETDISTVAIPIDNPLIFVSSAARPPKDMKSLIAYLKTERAPYLSSGPGTGAHVLGAAFLKLVGANGDAVHYKSAASGIPDLIAGRVVFQAGESPSVVAGQIKEGKLLALAVFSDKRFAGFPDVPTMVEAGVPNVPGYMKQGSPLGMYVPAKTPESVQARINDAVYKALATPVIRKRLDDLGVVTGSPMTHRQAQEAYRRNLASWKEVIQATGIKDAVKAATN